MRGLALAAIGLYQASLRPILPPSCRFSPSCSDYARDAFRGHAPWRAALLALRRLLGCHPFNAGGFDPVPQARYRAWDRASGAAPCARPNG